MTGPDHARRFLRRDGTAVRALPFDGRASGYQTLLQAFPGRIRPHPRHDDAVLVRMASGREVRVERESWVVETPDGAIAVQPDDQFQLSLTPAEAFAA